MSEAPAIEVVGVSKSFALKAVGHGHGTLKTALTDFVRGKRDARAVHRVLRDVSFTVERGEAFGLVGRNGSGKSTLLRLVAGIYRPDAGRIVARGRVASLLELGAGFHQDFTGIDNIFIEGAILGLTRRQISARLDDIVEFAELGAYIRQPLRTYSSGMFMRLAFAVAVHVDPDILLIDEVLAVGDEGFRGKCYARLEEFRTGGRTILMVSHDLGSIGRWCDRALWLEDGGGRLVGPASEVARAYHDAVSQEASAAV